MANEREQLLALHQENAKLRARALRCWTWMQGKQAKVDLHGRLVIRMHSMDSKGV